LDPRYARLQAIIDKLTYKDWEIRLGTINALPYLYIRFIGPDASTGDPAVQVGRKWLLSEDMEESAVVQTALKAVLTAEEHEAREEFRYQGRAIFGPHFESARLARIFLRHNAEVAREQLGEKRELTEREKDQFDSLSLHLSELAARAALERLDQLDPLMDNV
jgi:hypothetical protein